MLDEECLNLNNSLYGIGVGGLSSARSNSNLSQIHGGYYHMPSMMPTSGTAGSTTGGVYYARSDYAESRCFYIIFFSTFVIHYKILLLLLKLL